MGELLQIVVNLISTWISYLLPFAILGDDQVGVIRRFGKFHHNMHPGINWKIPLVDRCLETTSALDSTMLQEQSLTTADDVALTLRGVITYRVVDPRKYILGVATTISVMNDVGCRVIADLIPTLTSKEILHGEAFSNELLRRMRLQAKRWGVKVYSVGVVDRVATPVYRFIIGNGRGPGDIVPPGTEL